MASHRRPKQPGRARVTVLTATAAAAVALTANSAGAAPKDSKAEVKEQVDKLYEEAEHATEKFNGAREKQDKLQDQVDDIQDKVARQQAELNDLQDELGSLASAQYRSGGVDPSVQLFLSSDPDDYLSRASTLDQLTAKQAGALEEIKEQKRALEQQRTEASSKLAELEETRKELGEQKKEVQAKLAKAQKLLNTLTAEEQAALKEEEERASRASTSRASLGNEGSATQRAASAFAVAQGKVGSPYVYGASGPSSFDCSGLTSWSFAQVGVAIPRTSQQQANIGTRLTQSQLQPGDLVFFYSDLHHVGFYAGNGQILHAPKPGAVVRYESINNMPFMFGVRV
ncbi:C40 family peptidase [Streptomyces thermolineatus]|uniref:C40 family peptidase n=1 Tax=Streptomyces thermolineatus TaxID=44033 RepID=A0ABP5Z4A0_9ACTN